MPREQTQERLHARSGNSLAFIILRALHNLSKLFFCQVKQWAHMKGHPSKYLPNKVLLCRKVRQLYCVAIKSTHTAKLFHSIYILSPLSNLPVLMAQSDAQPTIDKEVEGSIPDTFSNIHLWRLIMKHFLPSYSPFL